MPPLVEERAATQRGSASTDRERDLASCVPDPLIADPLIADPLVAPEERPERTRWFGGALIRGVGVLAQLGGLSVAAYALLFHMSIVRGSSMVPGIHDGDRILIDHLSYVVGDVQRGDVVVLRCPLDEELDYVKRVIGLPGDLVQIEAGRVSVNGETLEEPYIAGPDTRSKLVQRVAPDHYFVLGDNRAHSSDSREFGQVPRRLLRGRVDLRVWPPDRAGAVR